MAEISLRKYHEQIEALLEESRLVDAVAHCRHILHQYPRHIPTYRLLGKALLEQHDITGATDIFQRILSADPEDFIAHVGLSIIYKGEGLPDEARWHMERAFEMDPYNNVIQAELKDLFAGDGQSTDRLALTREALARLYVKGELYQQAVSELRRSLEIYPDRVDLKTMLAEALWRDEQRVDAVEVCLDVLEDLPNCIKANAILAEVWLITGRVEEAQGYLRQIQPLLLLEKGDLENADSPAIIAFQTEGAMPLPDQILVETLDEELLFATAVTAEADWVKELGIEGQDGEADQTPDWLTALEAAAILDHDGTGEPDRPGIDAEDDKVAGIYLDQEVKDIDTLDDESYISDIDTGFMKTIEGADQPPVPDWLEEIAAFSTTDAVYNEMATEPAGESEEAEEGEFPTWLAAAAAAAMAAKVHETPEEEIAPDGAAFTLDDSETIISSPTEKPMPDWLSDLEEEDSTVDEAWLREAGDELETRPDEDDWSSWLAGEDEPEPLVAVLGAAFIEEGHGVDKEWEESLMSEDMNAMSAAGAGDEMDDFSTPPEDLDDALAWLEGLAARQGARLEELPSLNEAGEMEAETDVGSAYPDWLAGDFDDFPAEFDYKAMEIGESVAGAAGGPVSDDIPDWLLDTVSEVPTGPDLVETETVSAAEDLSWLDEIAAGGGSPLDEPLTLSWDKRPAGAEPSESVPSGFDAGLGAAALVPEEPAYDEPPEDLNEAMAWLEQLAARQGARLDELPTVSELPAEGVTASAMFDDEPAIPDWLAGLEAEEDIQEEDSLIGAGAMALGALALGAAVAGKEDQDEAAKPDLTSAAADLTDDFPEDPEDALAWLEQLAREDEVSDIPFQVVEEPPTPAVPHDILAAQAAMAAVEAVPFQEEEFEPAAIAADQPAGIEDEWIEQIPDDPDAAMLWLEQLAARQGAPLEELPSVDEIPEEVEIPDWISREVAEAQSSLLAGVDEPAGELWDEPALEPEPVLEAGEEPIQEPAAETGWQEDMDGEIAEALPDWLSLDLAEVPPVFPDEGVEDWDDAYADVTGWLVAEEELQVAESKSEPVLDSRPEPVFTPVEEAVLVPAGSALPRLQNAREAVSQGNINQALETYQSLLSSGEDLDSLIHELEHTQVDRAHQPRVKHLLGDAYMQTGDLQKALETYQAALDML